jgi:hypothetical protein
MSISLVGLIVSRARIGGDVFEHCCSLSIVNLGQQLTRDIQAERAQEDRHFFEVGLNVGAAFVAARRLGNETY